MSCSPGCKPPQMSSCPGCQPPQMSWRPGREPPQMSWRPPPHLLAGGTGAIMAWVVQLALQAVLLQAAIPREFEGLKAPPSPREFEGAQPSGRPCPPAGVTRRCVRRRRKARKAPQGTTALSNRDAASQPAWPAQWVRAGQALCVPSKTRHLDRLVALGRPQQGQAPLAR